MKKILIALLLISFILPVFAQTTTSTSTAQQTNQQLIDSLKALIEQLKQQVAELQLKVQNALQSRLQIQQSAQQVRETVREMIELRKGMTSDEIKAVQQILATDPTIYPEGLITGYFGPATERALNRFREKYGVKEDSDKIGPKTLEEIMKRFEERNEIRLENGKKCVIIPPGHLIAPGLLKKTTSTTSTISDIPQCQVIPDGIQKLMRLRLNWQPNPTPTSTPTPTPTSTPTPTLTPPSTSISTPTSTTSTVNSTNN